MNKTESNSSAWLPELLWDIELAKQHDVYFYLETIEELLPNNHVNVVNHGEMIMLGGYSYLGLINHPYINAAAVAAIKKYSTGTHGVRLLAGTLDLHNKLEARIATFKNTQAAIVMSSGYVANLTTISSLLQRRDVVICDKLDHASIVDGCKLSMAKFVRFRHNDMDHLAKRLAEAAPDARKLVVVDAVFSMDGDIIDLPEVSRLCRHYGAWLMVDEAHSLGVLGGKGHGIEEHFDMPPDAIDLKMGTLSKAIPSIGGYIAGSEELINYLRHQARAFIFSAAISPPAAAAAQAAFDVIEEETWRVAQLQENLKYFSSKLRQAGFELLNSETAIIPIICGSLEKAFFLSKHCQDHGIFVQAIVSPVVPEGLERLRACVSATHTKEDLDFCINVLIEGSRLLNIIT